MDLQTLQPTPAAGSHPFSNDLNWLLHRVAAGLGSAEDDAARQEGLGIRAYIVLATIAQSPPTTQLALGEQLGLDKTAVTSVLDRLEGAALILRRPAPGDRRVRYPEATEAGRAIAARIRVRVEQAEAVALTGLNEEERSQLALLLTRLARGPLVGSAQVGGSCI